MCGLTGFWMPTDQADDVLRRQVRCMADALTHRGPDDAAEWSDAQVGIALGFRRLAIVDLTPEGRQPMCSASGRYVLAFNGEVYNHAAVRRRLEPMGHVFRGHSDTEVMLAAFVQWGVEGAVREFVGMFAFALWDRQLRQLTFGRDRLGIKPLYYGWLDDTLLFGSELKAMRIHPAFRADVDRGALSLFMRHGYVSAPYTIYEHVQQLPAGSLLTIGPDRMQRPVATVYWSAREAAELGALHPFGGNAEEAAAQLDAVLRDAIGLRMIADVPLGAFLSGGIDSSTVVALMQAQSAQPVKTFSIGFHETGYNEARHALAVAQHLGTDHTELYVTPEEAQAVIPNLADMYDEPFADSSQIPTYLVSQLARRKVTVSLSGDGGDELFAGYQRYRTANTIWSKVGWLPRSPRQGLAWVTNAGGRLASRTKYDSPRLRSLLSQTGRPGPAGDKLQKLAAVLAMPNQETLYRDLISHWKTPETVVIGGYQPPTIHTTPGEWAASPDFTHRMMHFDTVSYLPDDILTKIDRASMAVSLEARVPLLDHRVVEFAGQLPLSLKVRNGQSKWILRQVLYRYVPRELVERPKMGFGVPIGDWLRGPLRSWAAGLLDEGRLKREGFFRPAPILMKWQEHLSGLQNWQAYLWDVLMFQAWQERWLQTSRP